MGFSLGSLTKGISSGLNAIGSGLNALTGVTSSSNQAFSQSKYLANLSFNQNKYFATHAHQMEMQDLANAGLNPALTAHTSDAGSIASDGGVSNSGYTGTSASVNPLSIIDTINSTRQTNAQNQNLKAGAQLQKAQAFQIIEMLPISKEEKRTLIRKMEAETKFTNERARGFSESTSTTYSNSDGEDIGASYGLTGVSHKKGKTSSATKSISSSRTW